MTGLRTPHEEQAVAHCRVDTKPGIILYYCPMAAMFWWTFLVLTVFEVLHPRAVLLATLTDATIIVLTL